MRPGPSLLKKAFIPLLALTAASQALFFAGSFLLFTSSSLRILLFCVRTFSVILFLYAGLCAILCLFRRFSRRLAPFLDVSPLFAGASACSAAVLAAISALLHSAAQGNQL